jgi:hypothetical protein
MLIKSLFFPMLFIFSYTYYFPFLLKNIFLNFLIQLFQNMLIYVQHSSTKEPVNELGLQNLLISHACIPDDNQRCIVNTQVSNFLNTFPVQFHSHCVSIEGGHAGTFRILISLWYQLRTQ